MTPATPKKEVGCLALTFFYDYLEARKIDRRQLQTGLPYTPEYLDNRTNWIDYQTFLEIERRMERLLPDPNLFYEIGLSFGATRGFGFLRPVFRSVISPFQAYSVLPRAVGRFLFPFVQIRFERLPGSRIRGTYRFREGFAPTHAFLETVRGILTGIPLMMGVERAHVSLTQVDQYTSVFEVQLAETWAGPIKLLRRVGRQLVSTLRMIWSSSADALTELESTNKLLQEKVDDLTQAKLLLDRRVHQLSALNAVARTASAELDLRRLIERTTATVSRELGNVPVGVLLAEGEPAHLVLAASAGLDARAAQALMGGALEQRLVQDRSTIVETPAGRFTVARMMRRDQLIAALAVQLDQDGADGAFLESLADHLALSVDNAQAYRVITDLRDNLEVRVRERTAELQDARVKLEDTVERLRRSDRARNEFFTNVSHELRTPLTLILAPLDALNATLAQAGPEARPYLQLIRENAQSLLRLINEILDFAKLDAERMPLRPAQTDLRQLVADTLTVLRPLADRKQVALSLESPPQKIGACVDPELTRRAVLNLVGNAIKYVEAGGFVRVSAAATDDEATIAVTDNGPGIAPEQHARIFERFQRVADESGRIVQGSGIGLAMVKEIVQLHRGRIEIESTPSQGATFRMHLPRHALAAASAPATMPAKPAPDEFAQFVDSISAPVRAAPPKSAAQPAGRLLIVEDNDDMRDFLVRLLGGRYTLVVARDGEEGLAQARAKLPDAVVSDVMMPKLDGYAMCRRLKADPETRAIPVILVSARHGTDAALEGFEAGADDFIVKPFSAPELLARISAQIRIRSLSLTVMRMEKQTTLGLMAAGIAHEVLNPVNAIINAVPSLQELVAEGGGEREIPEALLQSIDRSGRRIQKVVQAILAFSRQDHGELRLRELRLSEGIENTLAILAFRIHDGIAIHRDFAWNGTLDCYPELLNQLVMNLLVNAFDAVGPRGGNVWIALDRTDQAVVLRVRDDGTGVAPALRERIFDPFFTTKPVGSGTGLGLPLAREIASLHGGTLTLSSGAEGGAEFTLTLPIEATSHFPAVTADAQAFA